MKVYTYDMKSDSVFATIDSAVNAMMRDGVEKLYIVDILGDMLSSFASMQGDYVVRSNNVRSYLHEEVKPQDIQSLEISAFYTDELKFMPLLSCVKSLTLKHFHVGKNPIDPELTLAKFPCLTQLRFINCWNVRSIDLTPCKHLKMVEISDANVIVFTGVKVEGRRNKVSMIRPIYQARKGVAV